MNYCSYFGNTDPEWVNVDLFSSVAVHNKLRDSFANETGLVKTVKVSRT